MRKLPRKYREIYENFYIDYSQANTFFRKLSLFVEKWYHLKAYKAKTDSHSILEIGAGNLNHVKFEKNFKIYDVVEPKDYLIKASDPVMRKRVRNVYKDIENIPEDFIYDKIISIGVLEHIENLELILEKITKKLCDNGKFIVVIPAEGEFLWWLGWRLTTGIGFWLKYRLDYGVIMRFEHVNKASKIIASLKKYFNIVHLNSFPLNFKNWRLYIHIVLTKKN